jgi:hypothetical protein
VDDLVEVPGHPVRLGQGAKRVPDLSAGQ